ncbi:uroporphyrinogen-III synthase [Bryobacter aggregatus]|uniref:uroporphyrinogen-III synthase n=1 Tax=Bryobacter aggregatus TaxID=360054 RepID=UPI0004E1FF46|nr:uroporphyrinogen-III synthase [Bryobacter aggregatus]
MTRVLAFESRRANEIAILFRNLGWEPTVVPVFSEAPQDDPKEALQFAADLFAGRYEQVIFLTGVGIRHLLKTLAPHYPQEAILAALQKIVTVPRGPKPSVVLREFGITPSILIREPATWREILATLQNEPKRSTAVIEYGRSDTRLLAGLTELGIPHQSVAVYHYEFPSDLSPVRDTLQALAGSEFDIVVFTSSVQYQFLVAAAETLSVGEGWKQGLRGSYVASIGPTMTETLEADGIPVAFTPSASKMGILAHELSKVYVAKAKSL